MFNYPGSIHIHSRYSDGSGDMAEITQAAASAGLSYIIITDHETLEGLNEETIHQGVAVLVGVEINRLHNHYLVLNTEQLIESNENNPQQLIDAVRNAGGIGFIAHPFEKGSAYIEKGKAYPWINWPVFHFNGMEIWNYTSHWRGRHPSLIKTVYSFIFDRKGAMDSPPADILKLWDCYTTSGHKVVGIGSTDAHAFNYSIGFLRVKIFSYKYIFKTIKTYIILGRELSNNFVEAKKQILNALEAGNCYFAFDSLYPAKNFNYHAVTEQIKYLPGSTLAYDKDIILIVTSPLKRSVIRMIRDGKVINQSQSGEMVFQPTTPGVYRVEVFYKPLVGRPRPWIYANPFYLEPSSGATI
ncbi:MAG: CehA/McbA family metallohydrolase [Bacillota bacterium]|nr:CehA/McbA family metallohydrolase [Bacillota bacterium]